MGWDIRPSTPAVQIRPVDGRYRLNQKVNRAIRLETKSHFEAS
jgi:hypothetical protein